MPSLRHALVAAVLLPGVAATALAAARRAPPSVDYVPASSFDRIREYAARTRTFGGTVAIARDQQTAYMLVRRTAESEVEEHSRWDDVLIVRSGSGAVLFGAAARGARVVAPGELRGGTLTDRASRVVRVGDVLRIPAGVPHAFLPADGQPWELMIVKVRRPSKPLRRTAG